MMTSDFTARRVTEMRPHIQELVDSFLQTMIEKGAPADLVRDYALPIPSMVICRLLGVPYADHEFFEVNSAKSLDMSLAEVERMTASGAVYNYISELLQRKLSEPGDDLITRLAARVEQSEMSHATAAMTGFIMLQAGHETTASMIALGALALLQHREAFERLSTTEDPAVIANAVDELMRYLSIVHSLIERTALEDMTIGGQQIAAGDLLLMNIPAGNWDPEYTENPEVFDIIAIRADTLRSVTECTNASGSISPVPSYKLRCPRWRGGYRTCGWWSPRRSSNSRATTLSTASTRCRSPGEMGRVSAFSAIHTVVKRCSWISRSTSWLPMKFSMLPPTSGMLTSTVALNSSREPIARIPAQASRCRSESTGAPWM